MHTSKAGSSVLITSPNMTSSFFCSGVPCTRFVTSAAILGSNSTQIHFLARSSIRTVRLPVPGPTFGILAWFQVIRLTINTPSSTTSVGFKYAFSTMASETPGFLRMCWPKLVLNLKTLFLLAAPEAPGPPFGRSYGVPEALLRFACFVFAMVGMSHIRGVDVQQIEGRWEFFLKSRHYR